MNEAVYEQFRFIEEKLYWLQFIRFFRGPFIVQMLHIPALRSGRPEARCLTVGRPYTYYWFDSYTSNII